MSQRLIRSICGFPGKEKAAKASPASKNHILSSLFEVYLCIYIFVYLCICVKCICLFVDSPGKERKQKRSS